MECAHCEAADATFLYGFDDPRAQSLPYCDIHCGKAHKRQMLDIPFRQKIEEMKKIEFPHLAVAQKRVDAGDGHLSSHAILKSLQDQLRAQGIQVADLDAAIAKDQTTFSSMNECLKWSLLDKKITKICIKILENILARNKPAYLAFKERLLEDWAELLDSSPNDQMRHQIGLDMTGFYPLFKLADVYF